MKTEKSSANRLKSPFAWGITIFLLSVGVFIWLPHRTETLEAHSTLQNGMNMSVRVTFESAWGWTDPSRLTQMDVTLDGKQMPITREAYKGLQPFDSHRKPMIAEKEGFPEIIMGGAPKSSLKNVRWYFLNYGFSELDVLRGREDTISYFGGPLPVPKQVKMADYGVGKSAFVLETGHVEKSALKDLNK